MLTFGYKLLQPAACLAVTLWISTASACNVPVFRYALERWEADPYEIVVFHSGPLSTQRQALLERMEQAGQDRIANLNVVSVDLAGEVSQPLRALWARQEDPSLPWVVVRYPRQAGIERATWAGVLSEETVGSLLESPGRKEIAQRLLRGDAVIWLLLGSGNKRSDDGAEQLVEAELRKLEKSLTLPERSEFDPPTNPDLPLNIAFSTMRIARTDPAERMLVNMLLNWSTNLTARTEVMLFPIFGRGRVIPPAVGRDIRADAIREMAEFLTGPCSCEVKEINPGYDLLLTASWNSLSGYQEVMLPEPPPLTGMSQFAAAAATNRTPPGSEPAVLLASSSGAPTPVGRHYLVRNLAILLGAGLVFLAVTTIALRSKAGRRPR